MGLHRQVAAFTIAALGVLSAGCGTDERVTAPGVVAAERLPDVDPTGPTAPTTPPEPSTSRVAPPVAAGSAVDPGDLLITPGDLPDWQVSDVEPAPGARGLVADCQQIQPLFDLVAAPSETSVSGSLPGDGGTVAAFHQAVVATDGADAAAEIVTALGAAWEPCTQFATESSVWWSEPFEMPAMGVATVGLAIGDAEGRSRLIGIWQLGAALVVLDISGPEAWIHGPPLIQLVAGKLYGVAPSQAPDASSTTTEPLVEMPVSTEPPDEPFDWRSRVGEASPQLAALLPSVDELGEEWEFAHDETTEAGPPDANDALDGCDAVPPPQLDGISLVFDRRVESEGRPADVFMTQGELQIAVHRTPDVAALDAFVGSFDAMFDCPLHTLGPASEIGDIEVQLPEATIIAKRIDFDTGEVPIAPPTAGAHGSIVLLRHDPYVVLLSTVVAHPVAEPAPFEVDEIARIAWLIADRLS